MTDIVEQLLEGIGSYGDLGRVSTSAGLIRQAAAEIEMLRKRCGPTHVVLIGDTGFYVGYEVFSHIEELNAKLETADALVTCCCGSPVDTHGMGDGHSPVDMYHYRLMQIEKTLDAAKDEAMFLIDRLDEFESDMNERDYFGHVHPSRSRLYGLVSK
jgi:hypothetical protein